MKPGKSDFRGQATQAATLCMVAPSHELRARMRAAKRSLRSTDATPAPGFLTYRQPERPGLNDGTIIPADRFPLGTPGRRVRRAAAERAPLRGTVRVVVVLAEFSDKKMTHTKKQISDLFFSVGTLPKGSVREYFTEVSNGLITIEGEVVGPYKLPKKMSAYAHGESGTGVIAPNAQTMARDAAKLANPDVDFAPYDNDGNGFVDAFIVMHAGRGAEETGSGSDIWSHKWTLSGSEMHADGTNIFAYLTVPEDSKIGVCAHELGHLLFGWPDLYDIDDSSEGLGDWCLMAGGSWNGNGGDVPAHPSAWCKQTQDWVTVTNQTKKQTVKVKDVKTAHEIYRLWSGGAPGTEFFLVENRQKTGYDRELPSEGLFVYHVDDSLDVNSDETHYKVGLVQADGQGDLEADANQGDAGDPYPGSTGNKELSGSTTPNSNSHAGLATKVAIRSIGASGPTMSVQFDVGTGGGTTTDPTLKQGSKGPAVARLQQSLLNLGFDPGPIDGDFGPKTKKAVIAYQKSRGLVADGIVGPKTWAAIHADGE